jgi:hypothetical protein
MLALAFVSRIASAHETDQYTVPEARDLADLRLYFSQDIYRRLQNAVNNTNERIRHSLHDGSPTPATAHLQAPLTMGWALFAEFPPALLHVAALEMQVHSEEVRARYPGLLTAFMPPHWIYDNAILRLDVFRPVRNARTSTILVNGVYFGTDKIAHFVNVGFAYFRAYESARRAGRDTEAALRSAVNVGIGVNLFYSEHTILGGLTTGVFSNADLAANYAGFTFFRNLTEAVRVRGELRPPMLVRDGELWKLADYVRPDSDFFVQLRPRHRPLCARGGRKSLRARSRLVL